jgi:ketosteroid isomerase-like protein
VTTDTTAELARAYYASWQHGATRFDEARLRTLLAPDLEFDGPLAGHRIGAEGFLKGLADFARRVTSLHMLEEVSADNRVALMYDCDVVGADKPIRFAEFLRIEHDRIQAITLLYDKGDFLSVKG